MGHLSTRQPEPGEHSRKHVHLFDMEGTLSHGSSASLEIADHLGTRTEIDELEKAFAEG
jgi:phosphoserine phosphatase